VMNPSKLHKRMYQAVMEQSVNVLSPVMSKVEKADAFHSDGRPHFATHYWQELCSFSGVLGNGMMQDGDAVNLGELKDSFLLKEEYVRTSQIRQGRAEDFSAVGATRSTRSMGKLCTWGRGCGDGAGESALGFLITPRVL
jgi:hypothetical protein